MQHTVALQHTAIVQHHRHGLAQLYVTMGRHQRQSSFVVVPLPASKTPAVRRLDVPLQYHATPPSQTTILKSKEKVVSGNRLEYVAEKTVNLIRVKGEIRVNL